MSEFTIDPNNQEFIQALDWLENTRENLFITGEAGTGKSSLLRHFLESVKKNVAIVAPTGLAAINVGGQTIHKFFQFPVHFINPSDIGEIKFPNHRKLIKKLQTLVIDEVSMLRADVLDGIDQYLRINRRNQEPFGGVQIVLVGDLFQLPPVVGREEQSLFLSEYPSAYFFDSRIFNQVSWRFVKLTKNYRQQNDLAFIQLLEKVKRGTINSQVIAELNSRVLTPQLQDEFSHNLAVYLSTTNQIVLTRNQESLFKLSGQLYEFKATVDGQFNIRDCPAEEILHLKLGAQVMFLKNDPQGRWVNGTMGVVHQIEGDGVFVKKANGKIVALEAERWENIKYVFDEEQERVLPQVVGYMEQFPLKLAWAVTIHKSQGQTFDKAVIDLGYGSFAHGQTYVALSRCRTLEGIALKRPIKSSDFLLDKKVVKFMDDIVWNDESETLETPFQFVPELGL